MLLLFMDEEKAFWMLVIITQRYLPGVHEVNLEGVNIDQGVLMLCVRESLPELWSKVGVNFEGQHYENFLTKLPPITLCTASWFMSGFIGILPTETVLRVWDCFFFEDSKIFFRVALTILKLSEAEILHSKFKKSFDDQMEIFQAIQNLPRRLIDSSMLMEKCFKRRNGFGHISQQEIINLRKFVATRRREVMLLQQQRQVSKRPGEDTNRSGFTEMAISSSTDLQEYKKLRAGSAKKSNGTLHVQLSKRMKSLKFKNTKVHRTD
jgi:hypothetical protein